MKSKILVIFLFLAFLFTGDRVAAVILQWLMGHSEIPVAQLYAKRLDGNIILLGNSRAYRHFPLKDFSKDFKQPVVNLAYPGISTRISVALLEDYIDTYGPPRLVIAEVSDVLIDQQSISVFRHFTTRSSRLSAILKDTYPDLFHAGLVSHLFNFNNPMFLNSLHKIAFPLPDLRLSGTMSAANIQTILDQNDTTKFKIVPENRHSLALLTTLAQRHEFDLRLVIAPFLPELVEPESYIRWQHEISQLTDNQHIWDYGLNPAFRRSFFYDRNHLNEEGVKIFLHLLRRDGFFAMKDEHAGPTRSRIGLSG